MDTKTAAHRLFVGTSNPRPGDGDGPGIFAAYLCDGVLTEPVMVAEGLSPSFLVTSPASPGMLYTVLGGDYANAVAAAYRVDDPSETAAQTLTLMSQADCGSPGGCHIVTSGDGRILLSSNYTGASVASFRVDEDGSLNVVSVPGVAGRVGPNAQRQEAPHPHCAAITPDGGYVLVSDLGLDCILVYRLDTTTGELTPHTPDRWVAAPGAGPRHLLFHPSGTWLYSINELNSTIDLLAWDAGSGTLALLSTVSTVPQGQDTVDLKACEVLFSPDTRFLYASNRIHESFVVFTVDAATGALEKLQELPNPGRESRHISFDPTGQWFLSANQFSGDISVFPVDPATGLLGPRTCYVEIAGPSCLLFV